MGAPEAEPKPEADAAADAWYSYYGYGHPGYYGAYRRYYGLGWGGYYGGYYGYPRYGYRYWKRDAEAEAEPKAEAEADPAVLYSSVYGHGLTYRYYANSAGVVHAVAKREADEPVGKGPNPEADADAWYGRYYGGYYGYPRYYGGYYGRRWGYGYGWGK